MSTITAQRPEIELSLAQARRVALAAQGFGRGRPKNGVRSSHLRNAIMRMGLLQLDFVNVLVPAHYLVLYSRLGAYSRQALHKLLYHRQMFTEQWAHEASIVPVDLWPFLRYRRQSHRVRPWGFEKFLEKNATYARRVLQAVEQQGALTADDLPEFDGEVKKSADGWGWNFRRQVLEAYFGTGQLAIADRRPNFQRVYDLPERVLPERHLGQGLNRETCIRHLLSIAATASGVGTAADLADYFRIPIRESRAAIANLVTEGKLRSARVEGWREPAYMPAGRTRAQKIEACSLLSPFDPVVWFRPRTERLFDFHYRIEIYVPQKKRKWGYYVLPFLLGDRLAARVDVKADRKNKQLLVPAAHIEEGEDADEVVGPLAGELRALAAWLDLESVKGGRRGGLARPLAGALR